MRCLLVAAAQHLNYAALQPAKPVPAGAHPTFEARQSAHAATAAGSALLAVGALPSAVAAAAAAGAAGWSPPAELGPAAAVAAARAIAAAAAADEGRAAVPLAPPSPPPLEALRFAVGPPAAGDDFRLARPVQNSASFQQDCSFALPKVYSHESIAPQLRQAPVPKAGH